MADALHERERTIKASRGEIVDRNGTVIAANRTVCTVSVIHNQVKEPEKVIRELARILDLSEEKVRKKVEKWSSREIIRTNVEKSVGDEIMNLGLSGLTEVSHPKFLDLQGRTIRGSSVWKSCTRNI